MLIIIIFNDPSGTKKFKNKDKNSMNDKPYKISIFSIIISLLLYVNFFKKSEYPKITNNIM